MAGVSGGSGIPVGGSQASIRAAAAARALGKPAFVPVGEQRRELGVAPSTRQGEQKLPGGGSTYLGTAKTAPYFPNGVRSATLSARPIPSPRARAIKPQAV